MNNVLMLIDGLPSRGKTTFINSLMNGIIDEYNRGIQFIELKYNKSDIDFNKLVLDRGFTNTLLNKVCFSDRVNVGDTCLPFDITFILDEKFTDLLKAINAVSYNSNRLVLLDRSYFYTLASIVLLYISRYDNYDFLEYLDEETIYNKIVESSYYKFILEYLKTDKFSIFSERHNKLFKVISLFFKDDYLIYNNIDMKSQEYINQKESRYKYHFINLLKSNNNSDKIKYLQKEITVDIMNRIDNTIGKVIEKMITTFTNTCFQIE